MAEPETAPTENNPAGGGGGMTPEQIFELAGMGVEGQIEAAQIGAESMLEQQARQQQFIREGAAGAEEIYRPYMEGGQYWLQRWKDLADQGGPKFSWDKQFDYQPWKWDKQFDYQGWDEYSKGRLTPEGAKSSPYYGLYQFQKEQQDAEINKGLRARGLFGSGAGMKKALTAQTGLDEKFAADEYGRALNEYGMNYDQAKSKYLMDYEQALQGHNIGYEEAKQKYGMSYDQYIKQFGADYGNYRDTLSDYAGMGQYGWLGAQAIGNARFGAGSQMGAGAIQTGQTLAGLQSNLASGIGSSYNAQMNTGANLYNAAQNRNLTQNLANQAQNNWNTYNSTGQTLGYATLGAGLARSGIDAYRYYNQPSNPGAGDLSSGYYNQYGTTGTVPFYAGTNANAVNYW